MKHGKKLLAFLLTLTMILSAGNIKYPQFFLSIFCDKIAI